MLLPLPLSDIMNVNRFIHSTDSQQSTSFANYRPKIFNGITMILHRFIDCWQLFFFHLTSFFFQRKGFYRNERKIHTHIDMNSVAKVEIDCLLIAHDVSAEKKKQNSNMWIVWLSWCLFLSRFRRFSLSFYFYVNRTSAIDEIQQTFADANWNWRYHDRNSQFIDRRHRCCCCCRHIHTQTTDNLNASNRLLKKTRDMHKICCCCRCWNSVSRSCEATVWMKNKKKK